MAVAEETAVGGGGQFPSLLPAGQLRPSREAFSDKTETKMSTTEMEPTETEEIQMEVVEVGILPEKFRPPTGGAPTTEDVLVPITGLIREAPSGLTSLERRVFLYRLREEHPEIFSGKTDREVPPEDPPGQFSKEKWREILVRQLKKEANRSIATAAGL